MKTNFTIRDVLDGSISRRKLENTLELMERADSLVDEVKMLDAVENGLLEFLKSVQVMKSTLTELAGEELTKSDIDTLGSLLERVREAFPKHLVLQYLGAEVGLSNGDDGEDAADLCDDDECLCSLMKPSERGPAGPQPFVVNLSAPSSIDPAAIRASIEQVLAGAFSVR